MTDRRFPRSVYGHGSEPDPRFSLANERTFLAWIRTSLAFVAAGVAIEALQLEVRTDFRLAAAIVLVTAGLAAAAQAWFGWARSERAMRDRRALPGPTPALAITVGVAVAVLFIALGLLL